MSPEPDWMLKRGPLLVRRWGRFVRVNWRKRSFAFNLPF